MGQHTPHTKDLRHPSLRGNTRTRGGPGRHNLGRTGFASPNVRVRICLNCNRPFKSRGPWNRLCHRCHEQEPEVEHEGTRIFRVPKEWPQPPSWTSDDP